MPMGDNMARGRIGLITKLREAVEEIARLRGENGLLHNANKEASETIDKLRYDHVQMRKQWNDESKLRLKATRERDEARAALRESCDEARVVCNDEGRLCCPLNDDLYEARALAEQWREQAGGGSELPWEVEDD